MASLAAFALAPGLALGSFMNVVAARVPLRRSLVSPGSACMSCGHEIGWRDNVPVVSWLLLRGRCRHCKASIPWRYPAVELTSALLVAGCVWKFGLHPEALVASFFCLVLVAISATDIEHGIIPNRIVLPAAVVILAAQTAIYPSPQWAVAALGAAGFLFVAALAAPRGMGMGDVKLALVLGAMLGTTVAVGDVRRLARRDGARDRPLHSPWCRRPEGQAPVRPVPRDRRRRRSLRRPRAAPGLLVARSPLALRANARGAKCRCLVRGIAT